MPLSHIYTKYTVITMHEKLIKQLRNKEHCGGCPYDKDCNEFDSCLMDLLAADAIEDMSKRIIRQENELEEKRNLRHGHWHSVSQNQDKASGICSICKTFGQLRVSKNNWGFYYIDSPYCPSCGSIMDGKINYI